MAKTNKKSKYLGMVFDGWTVTKRTVKKYAHSLGTNATFTLNKKTRTKSYSVKFTDYELNKIVNHDGSFEAYLTAKEAKNQVSQRSI